MLRRLALKDFVIVPELEIELGAGFTVLTGETGAGKSILVDALQLALGGRADAGVVREGAARTEIVAEFDVPSSLGPWLAQAGFDGHEGLLLRRSIDSQGRSRAWVNGSSATVAQLRECAEHLVDIHGQHAWQGLTQPAAVRALLDERAGVDPTPLEQGWARWRQALAELDSARQRSSSIQQERERLQWQLGELARLAPADGEWEELDAEHRRLAHAQSLLDATHVALAALADAEPSAGGLVQRAIDALDDAGRIDPDLAALAAELRDAQSLLGEATHSLQAYLGHRDPNPERLAELDARMSAWVALARRYRRPPPELPALVRGWQAELASLDAAADLASLEAAAEDARRAWAATAQAATARRKAAAPKLARAVTLAMQSLGMAGGQFEVQLSPLAEPQMHGNEAVEFLVAGHAGSTPRPLAKVASGGELSRLALAIAVTTAQSAGPRAGSSPATLIFDEVDAGIGGTVADTVGQQMRALGQRRQVLAVTHLAQVAACADAHLVVSKLSKGSGVRSQVVPVHGEARVAEVARMLGGGGQAQTRLAHAQSLLEGQP